MDIHNRITKPKGYVLGREGQPVNAVYLLTKGTVSMSSRWRGEDSEVRIGPGSMIGDVAVILEHQNPKYRSTYVALEPIEVVRFSVDELLSHIDDMKHFESVWLKSLARRISLLTFDQLKRTDNEDPEVSALRKKIGDMEEIIKNVDTYFLTLQARGPDGAKPK